MCGFQGFRAEPCFHPTPRCSSGWLFSDEFALEMAPVLAPQVPRVLSHLGTAGRGLKWGCEQERGAESPTPSQRFLSCPQSWSFQLQEHPAGPAEIPVSLC